MSHFIVTYAELFPDTKGQLDAYPSAAELAKARRVTWNEPEFQRFLRFEGAR
jgi:hypothetical protein